MGRKTKIGEFKILLSSDNLWRANILMWSSKEKKEYEDENFSAELNLPIGNPNRIPEEIKKEVLMKLVSTFEEVFKDLKAIDPDFQIE